MNVPSNAYKSPHYDILLAYKAEKKISKKYIEKYNPHFEVNKSIEKISEG